MLGQQGDLPVDQVSHEPSGKNVGESSHASIIPGNDGFQTAAPRSGQARLGAIMKCLDPVCELRDQHIGQATLGCHMIEQGVIGKAAHLQKPIDRFSLAIEVQAARRILGYRANRQVEFRRGPAIKP